MSATTPLRRGGGRVAVLSIAACAVLLGDTSGARAEVLLSVAPGGGQRPADPLLRTIDVSDGSTVPGASVTMTLAGHTVLGATGLARHPQTSDLYVLLKVQGSSFRRLATLDERTGVATDVGDTGRRFAAMAFASDGTLFAVTGDGSGVPETLFSVSIVDASSTELRTLGAGSDGEALGFDPDGNFLYHASGIGTPNHPNGEQFETIDPVTLEVSNVPLSGFDYEELTSMHYSGGAFFAGDLGNASSDAPRFFHITRDGFVTLLGEMDHVAKGLAEAAPAPSVPALAGPGWVALVGSLLAVVGFAQRGARGMARPRVTDPA